MDGMRGFAIDVARLTLWLGLLSVLFVPLERLFAVRPGKVFRAGLLTDLGYYFLNSLAPNLALILPTAALAWAMHALLPGSYLEAVAQMPVWLRLVAILIVGEVGFYWGHRLSHEIPLLWRFHAIHHSPEHVDFLVNTRAHPIDMVFTRLCGLMPIYVLGLAEVSRQHTDFTPVLLVLLGTVWGFFIHANVRWRLGWFEALVATPAFHHWHHTNDEHRDHNYASLLPWLDRIFGTHHLPKAWPPNYGIDAAMPTGLARQLVQPLGWRGPASAVSAPASETTQKA